MATKIVEVCSPYPPHPFIRKKQKNISMQTKKPSSLNKQTNIVKNIYGNEFIIFFVGFELSEERNRNDQYEVNCFFLSNRKI